MAPPAEDITDILAVDLSSVIRAVPSKMKNLGAVCDQVLNRSFNMASRGGGRSWVILSTDRYTIEGTPKSHVQGLRGRGMDCPAYASLKREDTIPTTLPAFLSQWRNKNLLNSLILKSIPSALAAHNRKHIEAVVTKVFIVNDGLGYTVEASSDATYHVVRCVALDNQLMEADQSLLASLRAVCALCPNSSRTIVTVYANDTDIRLVLGLYSDSICNDFASTRMMYGSAGGYTTVDCTEFRQHCVRKYTERDVCCLLALYVFSGCDTTASFFNIGKKSSLVSFASWLKTSSQNGCPEAVALDTLEQLSTGWPSLATSATGVPVLDDEASRGLEALVVSLYKRRPTEETVLSIRVRMFHLHERQPEKMPPTVAAIRQHALRCLWQLRVIHHAIHGIATDPMPDAALYGWQFTLEPEGNAGIWTPVHLPAGCVTVPAALR